LTTFTQLFFRHSDEKRIYTPLAPVKIHDAPLFSHRGINLDVSRNFLSVADIKRQINAAAYNKMNRLHLHATDSQSWPLVIPSLPNLARKGAYRPDFVYTTKDFADLQRHAALQGVQMITEIDMPGHTSSVWYSQPELIAAFNQQPDWVTYAAEPPSGTLKLNSTAVDAFLDTLFADLMPRVAPYTNYFHTGGDEVNLNAYELDDTVKSSDPAVLQPLMQRFVDRNHERVRKAGLVPVVWEEMLLTWNLTLGEDVVVQSWRSDEAVASIVEKGYKALVGNYNYWYLGMLPVFMMEALSAVKGVLVSFEDIIEEFYSIIWWDVR
jgi:hexosaminidase